MNKVLLVEDDEVSNFLSKIVLKTAGFDNIHEAYNGKEAYEHIEKDCPDIIFLDLNMPVMNGWEFLDEKKTHTPCKKVKIVVLTSSTLQDDKKKSKNYPCIIAYLEKPLTREKLEDVKLKMA